MFHFHYATLSGMILWENEASIYCKKEVSQTTAEPKQDEDSAFVFPGNYL